MKAVLLFIICGIIRAEPESARVYCHVTVFLLEWQINIIPGTIIAGYPPTWLAVVNYGYCGEKWWSPSGRWGHAGRSKIWPSTLSATLQRCYWGCKKNTIQEGTVAEQNDKQVKAFCCMQVMWHLLSPADVEQCFHSYKNFGSSRTSPL